MCSSNLLYKFYAKVNISQITYPNIMIPSTQIIDPMDEI
jgi:hypothetical protein